MSTAKSAVRHFLQFKDFTREEFDYLFERTRWIKGYILTAAVNLRRPFKWLQGNGVAGGLTMFGLILGTPLAFETPADGVMLKKAADVWMGTNLATGTPSFYRLEPLNDTGAAAPELVRLQGSVGPAGDLRLDVAALVIGEVQPVNYFDLQMPASMLG